MLTCTSMHGHIHGFVRRQVGGRDTETEVVLDMQKPFQIYQLSLTVFELNVHTFKAFARRAGAGISDRRARPDDAFILQEDHA